MRVKMRTYDTIDFEKRNRVEHLLLKHEIKFKIKHWWLKKIRVKWFGKTISTWKINGRWKKEFVKSLHHLHVHLSEVSDYGNHFPYSLWLPGGSLAFLHLQALDSSYCQGVSTSGLNSPQCPHVQFWCDWIVCFVVCCSSSKPDTHGEQHLLAEGSSDLIPVKKARKKWIIHIIKYEDNNHLIYEIDSRKNTYICFFHVW